MCRRMLAELQSESTARLHLTHLEGIWQGVEFKCFLLQLISDMPLSDRLSWRQLNQQAPWRSRLLPFLLACSGCCQEQAQGSALPLGWGVLVTLSNKNGNRGAGRREGRRKWHHSSAKPALYQGTECTWMKSRVWVNWSAEQASQEIRRSSLHRNTEGSH